MRRNTEVKLADFRDGQIDDEARVPLNRSSLRRKRRISRKKTKHRSKGEDYPDFIKRHFTELYCDALSFVADPKKENRCKCGRDLSQHQPAVSEFFSDERLQSDAGRPWQPLSRPAQTFGLWKVDSMPPTEPLPYVRLAHDTPSERVWDLLIHYWALSPPNLMISVTGGAQNFSLKPRLLQLFKRGLAEVLKSGGWIITGGTATGVMKIVGQAVEERRYSGVVDHFIPAIGIASWGVVKNQQEFLENSIGNPIEKTAPVGKVPLDYNHTHFLLVDDGTQGHFGVEIEFRARLEAYIGSLSIPLPGKASSSRVPVVSLVLEGGFGTLKTVVETLTRKVPVVVIQGSGRVADFIAAGYHLVLSKPPIQHETFLKSTEFQTEIMSAATRFLNIHPGSETAELAIAQIQQILAFINEIFVLDLQNCSTFDFPHTVLKALLESSGSNMEVKMDLALAWDRCSIARTEIIGTRQVTPVQSEGIKNSLQAALVDNRVEFVKLFLLEMDVNILDFLTHERLYLLYQNALTRKRKTLIDNFNRRLSFTASTHHGLMYAIGKLICKATKFRTNIYAHFYTQKRSIRSCLTDLFLWAVLLGRIELAKLFWELGTQHLLMLMLAAVISNWFSEQAESWHEVEAAEQWDGLFKQYDSLLCDLLSECYHADKEKAWNMLVCTHKRFDSSTILEIANVHQLMNFVAQPAAQSKLSEIWRGGLPRYFGFKTIFVSMICPPVVMFLDFDSRSAGLTVSTSNSDHLMLELYISTVYKLRRERIEKEFPSCSFARDGSLALVRNDSGMSAALRSDLVFTFLGVSLFQARLMSDETYNNVVVAPIDSGDDIEERIIQAVDESCREQPSQARRVLLKCGHLLWIGRHSDWYRTFEAHFNVGLRGAKRYISLPADESFFSKTETELLSLKTTFSKRLQNLYVFQSAPVVKFWYNVVSSVLFLLLFSFMLLCRFNKSTTHLSEKVIMVWVGILFIDEIRQIFKSVKCSPGCPPSVSDFIPQFHVSKITAWMSDSWNIVDYISYITFMICLIFRFQLTFIPFAYTRTFYVFNLCVFFVRFLQSFYYDKRTGPKVIMIRRMLDDLFFFLMILGVFLVCYGVSLNALLYPNSEPTGSLLGDVLYKPYWTLFGEMSLEEIVDADVGNCTADGSESLPRCPQKNVFAPILLCAYLMLSVILLINLLIAMFSFTFEKIQENAEIWWMYHREELVYEYYNRPALMPPFIIIAILLRPFIHLIASWLKLPNKNEFALVLSDGSQEELIVFQKAAVECLLYGPDSKYNTEKIAEDSGDKE